MSEEEYWESDPEFKDDEFNDSFLIDEPEDITLIIMPKFEVDEENILEQYAKSLKKCRTLNEAIDVLRSLYTYAQAVSIIQNEIQELQNRAKSLEILQRLNPDIL